ncbi:hypothetical protein [Siccirubricoccus sp. G192]|uniref:hypothetical protein n=1 Tax=Siccirubricoccus sp. G192 TaxID=2849651 RepID=UPI001C2C4C95|nr:hypothetical protein [Siccirubricoccus sp. G192]MBV1798626.1 hypothetical protein [Siccirubricoccus sp. G192]
MTLLAGCVDAVPPAQPPDAQEVLERARSIGEMVRAASICNAMLSMPAQDRAARIEAAAIELHNRRGGVAARDAFLHALRPPAFDPAQHGRDRAAWCNARRAEIARMDTVLAGPEGAALVQRAEMAQAALR